MGQRHDELLGSWVTEHDPLSSLRRGEEGKCGYFLPTLKWRGGIVDPGCWSLSVLVMSFPEIFLTNLKYNNHMFPVRTLVGAMLISHMGLMGLVNGKTVT